MNLDAIITAGANQAILNVALTLCDPGDTSSKRSSSSVFPLRFLLLVLIAPYYICHLSSLQLAGSNVFVGPFDSHTFLPDWTALTELVGQRQPKLIVLTSPNNPSGMCWSKNDYLRLIQLCRPWDTWILIDQTYCDFVYDSPQEDSEHVSHLIVTKDEQISKQLPNRLDEHYYRPCGADLNYPNIVHISSFSKTWGMAGWRVGYILAPKSLTPAFRKVFTHIPTIHWLLHPFLLLVLPTIHTTFFNHYSLNPITRFSDHIH